MRHAYHPCPRWLKLDTFTMSARCRLILRLREYHRTAANAGLVGAAMCSASLSAVHMTAGHNALRGSGPGQFPAFDNAVAHVGCSDRRIDRLCHHCPSHSGELVGKRDGSDFGRPSCQQCCDPEPILSAMEFACLAALGSQLLSLKKQILDFDRMILASSAARHARTTSRTRLSLGSAMTRSSSSMPLRPTSAVTPNSARTPDRIDQ